VNAEPAEHHRAQPVGMRQRQERSVACAHRVAHDVGTRQPKVIEQRAHILRHQLAVIGSRIVKLGRLAVAAIVERDDTAAGADERRDPAGIDPVHLFVGGKAVDEHDRLALPFVEIGDLHFAVHEIRHQATLSIRSTSHKDLAQRW
jgi:hypothetical protein